MIRLIIIALVIIVIFFVIVMIIDGNRFVVRQYSLQSEKLSKEYCFVLLADLHNKQYGSENEKLIAAIDEIHPDSVMCAGDILTARPGKTTKRAEALMHTLASKYPVYYGIGNHEYRMKLYPETYEDQYEKYIDVLKQQGITVLYNEEVKIPMTNITVTGSVIDRAYYKRFQKNKMDSAYLNTLLPKRDMTGYDILLAHNPEYMKQYAEWGADLILSGHVHGGVMRLPVLGGVISPKLTLFPKYDGGLFKQKNSTMVLSRGLGMHTLPIRIFNPGELVVVHLLPCK